MRQRFPSKCVKAPQLWAKLRVQLPPVYKPAGWRARRVGDDGGEWQPAFAALVTSDGFLQVLHCNQALWHAPTQLRVSRRDRAGQGVMTAARPVGAAGGYDSGECGGTGTSAVTDTPHSLTPRSGRPRCHDRRKTCRSCWRLRQWRMRWDRYIIGDRHAAFAALVTSDVSYRVRVDAQCVSRHQTVGASLLANAAGQPQLMLNDTPHSLPS
ncbi:hypothetical protein SAMN05216605_113136 [Pseudomonas abietaniphila]|uniref:Uncharacterized protein n=1 Tax=Pseudomonas abietaniphila TaxID=89065 RepID=A0A1G8KL68_9PSED|nr:hypothetical protein SAMN05216605_113136 [Pseudomonas abietaniphila]